MGMNETPAGERVKIGFFGRRNAGKSSLFNAVTGQELAVVSERRGTTTDPVKKSMELLPVGPVLFIDTPGFDDTGALGAKRKEKTRDILRGTDAAVLVAAEAEGWGACERTLLALFEEFRIPYLVAINGKDRRRKNRVPEKTAAACAVPEERLVFVNAKTGEGADVLKERLAVLLQKNGQEGPLIEDLLARHDTLVLVIPLDAAAPKGRLILPQQQVIRAGLEAGARVLCARQSELAHALQEMKAPPKLVVTDSQVFGMVKDLVPGEVPLTSFSILMARYKGTLPAQLAGVRAIDGLRENDRILVAEGCTHHRQCGDIGTEKLPAWLSAYTGKRLRFETASGLGFPKDLSRYALILHCGGCMLSARDMQARGRLVKEAQIPFVNYGMAIAHMNGILARALRAVHVEMPDSQ